MKGEILCFYVFYGNIYFSSGVSVVPIKYGGRQNMVPIDIVTKNRKEIKWLAKNARR